MGTVFLIVPAVLFLLLFFIYPFFYGLVLSFDGLAGTPPLWLDQSQNLFYCTISYFRVLVTDRVRRTSANFTPMFWAASSLSRMARSPMPSLLCRIRASNPVAAAATVRAI